jgi:hypothetical protein
MFRYWDGHAWSASLSPTPYAAPPSQGIGQAPGQQPTGTGAQSSQPLNQPAADQPHDGSQEVRSGPYGTGQYGPYGAEQHGIGTYGSGQHGTGPSGANQPGYGQPPGGYPAYQTQRRAKRRSTGWWIGGGALAVVIIVVGVFAIRGLTGGALRNDANPGSDPTQNACPTTTQSPTAPPRRYTDSRVHGGPVSYPRLSSPWGAPQSDDRVPFGSDVKEQNIVIEHDYQPGSDWVASVLVGQLQAGDGFFTPKQGSKIVAKCIASGEFYGDNKVNRSDQQSKSMQVDGHKAWYLKSHLSFNIKGLHTDGETMIIVIIQTGKSSDGLYYASIPDNAKQYLPTAEHLISKLTIGS